MSATYIIAETACSHDGSADRLKRLIAAAAEAQCDAVQIQVWQHENMVTPDHEALSTLQNIELSEQEWKQCADFARQEFPELELIACVYDKQALAFCNDIGVDAFKIHTADLGNYELLDSASKTRKRIDLSVGASTVSEIQGALDCIRGRCEVWLMYGYQLFPTPTKGLNLRYMAILRQLFGLPVGYQDHSPPDAPSANTIPVAALGSGINIIEKHITDDRSRKGADSEAALEPDEMVKFVSLCREAAVALGDGTHRSFTEEELKYRKYSKKSLVASRDLKAGEALGPDDVIIRRAPDLGIPADMLDETLGRTLRVDLKAYTALQSRYLGDS